MNISRKLLSVVMVTIGLYCCYNEEEGCNEPPLWCNESEPATGSVEVRISTDAATLPAEITFYDGKIEEGKVKRVVKQLEEIATYDISYGYLSASIAYPVMINDTLFTITSVDGGNLKYTSDDYCDNVTCYKPGHLVFDLRLDRSLLPASFNIME